MSWLSYFQMILRLTAQSPSSLETTNKLNALLQSGSRRTKLGTAYLEEGKKQ
jgi:hypothetical protein